MATDSKQADVFASTDRRYFLKSLSALGAALAATELVHTAAAGQANPVFASSGSVPRRVFGRTAVL